MQNRKKILSKVILCLSVTLVALLPIATAALAQAGARLYLQRVESADGILTLDVMAENVTDLYGLEIHLKYDPAVLEAQDIKPDQEGVQIEPGTLLSVDKGFVVANQVNSAEGKITYAITLLNPAPPVNGSGPVARISFNLLQNTPSTIEIERAQLIAFDLKTIPTELTSFSIGSDDNQEAAVAPPAPAPVTTTPATLAADNFPWWIVAAIVILLGLLGVGGFLILGDFSQVRRATPTPQPTQPNPVRRTGSGRPSAFK